MALFFTRAVNKMYAPSELVNKLEISTTDKTSELFGKTRTESVAYFAVPETNEGSAPDPVSEGEATVRSFSPATSSHTCDHDPKVRDLSREVEYADATLVETERLSYVAHGRDTKVE